MVLRKPTTDAVSRRLGNTTGAQTATNYTPVGGKLYDAISAKGSTAPAGSFNPVNMGEGVRVGQYTLPGWVAQASGVTAQDQGGLTRPQPIEPNMGFNAGYEDMYRELDQRKLNAQSQSDLALQRLQQQVALGQRDMETESGRAQKQVLDRMSAQGILRSGITAQEQGRIGEDYASRLNSMNQNAATSGDDIRRALQDILSGIEQNRGQLKADQARAQAEEQRQAAIANAQAQAAYEAAMAAQPKASATGQYSTYYGGEPVTGQVTQLRNGNVGLPDGSQFGVGGRTRAGNAPKSGLPPQLQQAASSRYDRTRSRY